MKKTTIHISLLLLLLLSATSMTLHAERLDTPLLSLPAPLLTPVKSYLASPQVLAATSLQAGTAAEDPAMTIPDSAAFSPPLFSVNKLHQYLGIGSLLFAGMAALTPPEEDEDEGGGNNDGNDDGFHHTAAVTAATLGGLAVATGFLFHHDDVGPRYGIGDPDNIHMLLGLLGTLGYATAVSAAPDEGHAAAGILGLASMAVAIKIEW